MKTFKAWWNSSATAVDDHPRRVAEAAWNFSYEMQEYRLNEVAKQNIELRERINELEDFIQNSDSRERIAELEEELKLSQQKHLDSIRALRRANEQLARDNAQLLYRSIEQDEPTEERAVKYIATVNEVCEDEADAFYMGTLDDIMEWCEDWNHCINDVKFYRLGDEVRVSFVDMGKETRFGGK